VATGAVTGSTSGVRGQPLTFFLSAAPLLGSDAGAGVTYTIDWGDGQTQTVNPTPHNDNGISLDHTYAEAGTYQVQVTATDRDGGTGPAGVLTVTVSAVALQPDPYNPAETALVVGGTTGDDVITLRPFHRHGDFIEVTINNVPQGVFHPTGHILVYSQAGNDTVREEAGSLVVVGGFLRQVRITVPAILFGGSASLQRDLLDARGSVASNVLVGGAGDDTLFAGLGRDILISGLGINALHGGGDGDIFIAGTTAFDHRAGALAALSAEWGSSRDYATRVANLTGHGPGFLDRLNSFDFLVADVTVLGDRGADVLDGGPGMDWFFATGRGEVGMLGSLMTGEVVELLHVGRSRRRG
jgi:Ca2+-binding RTX toxin-like protein